VKPASTTDDACSQVDDDPVPIQVVHAEQGMRTRSKASRAEEEGNRKEQEEGGSREEPECSEDSNLEFGLQGPDYAISEEDDELTQTMLMMMRTRLRR
jgi:hypothetical protein